MISSSRQNELGAVIKIRQHEITSGVMPSEGGHDEGPSPHELLEASLAACTIITLQMYANRKSWNLESVKVNAKIDHEGETSHITLNVEFIGDLNEEQRQRLLEISKRCPIHRLLQSQVKIETYMV